MSVPLVTDLWRNEKRDEKRQFDAGEISADECFMEELFPDEFIDRTEPVLQSFVDEVAKIGKRDSEDFDSISNAIKNSIVLLNQINADFDGAVIETGEREQLCQFIDDVLESNGINLSSLAEHLKCERHEITDDWRDW